MMSTNDKSPMLKNALSLTSSDLVSRFLAATPSYLYNVSSNSSNFFFSKMLRSFVQKNETIISHNVGTESHKTSLKDAHIRPIELTIKARNQHQTTSSTCTYKNNKFCNHCKANQAQQQKLLHHCRHQYLKEPRNKSIKSKYKNNRYHSNNSEEMVDNIYKQAEGYSINHNANNFVLKNERMNDYFSKKILSNSEHEITFSQNIEKTVDNAESKIDCTDNTNLQYSSRSFVNKNCSYEQKKYFEMTSKSLFPNTSDGSGDLQRTSDLNPTPDILSNPYNSLPQAYSNIDPLHFFIDLRVSGHIWDQKGNDKHIFNVNKHRSAFVMPQDKECNTPLNLTRRKLTFVRHGIENSKGTHYILKNLRQTYKKIWDSKDYLKVDATNKA